VDPDARSDPHARSRRQPGVAPGRDLAACEHLMQHGSRSFFAAGRLLPVRVRAPATALYAFCRVADDAIDLHGDDPLAFERLSARLDAIYAGRPGDHAADRAFAAVVCAWRLPRALPEALLEGFRWDAQGRCYETLDDVLDYGARVAGTVGAMMALVMGARSRRALARACELGVAMQLTNIARDVGEDARMGRLYLPARWLREAGLDPDAWLAAPSYSPALAGVIARLLDVAESLYARAQAGLAELPRDCRAAIQAARCLYREIGREVARHEHDAVGRRAVVASSRKLRLAVGACASAWLPGLSLWRLDDVRWLEPLPAVRFLVDASVAGRRDELPAFTFYQRTVRIIDLMERVGQRQRWVHPRA
jgi:phytoene synthase